MAECARPLILQGINDFLLLPRAGEREKFLFSYLTGIFADLQTTAKIWYNSLDFGEGVAIGLAGGTGPKEVLRVAEPDPRPMKGVRYGHQENTRGRYRNYRHSCSG